MLGGVTEEETDQALNYIENDIESECFKIGDIVYFFYVSKSFYNIFSGGYFKGKIVEKQEIATANKQHTRYKLDTQKICLKSTGEPVFGFSYDNDTYYTGSEISKTRRGLFEKMFKQNHIKICG